ncbi:Putative dehydratase/epimerase (Mannitol) [Lactobacillus equicursoris 66c]|uniref:Putative dehydratase/epimerase (Mannitol) n=1 Tax=Lactobacillus equicursoris 66c TaxID=872326 RepID=K0NMR6_9LACO|nr:NAD(P)-dependent oxidoreductase [Lactobacillus equicursoris]CCK82954.1 Putative dehydratase/epimerase (Mannitol) [Lactobacillus equicursoris 66c]
MSENVLLEDFNTILDSELDVSKFTHQNIFITGATGLIGSLLVKFLLYANNQKDLNITVYAMIRNQEKANKIFADYLDDQHLKFVVAHLGENDLKLDSHLDYIIHPAAVTQSKLMVSDPVGTIKTAVNGTEEILRFAVNHQVKAMVYVSSMEVYGQFKSEAKVTEKDLGFIDLTSARSCYPESKRMCELLCTAYSDEYGLNVKIARLAQTFGAGVLPTENRVFAQFAHSVIQGKDIVLYTEGKSEGNYVYTSDAIKALLFLLLNGETKQAYNVSNEDNHMTIREMAEMVVREFGQGGEKVVVDIPKENMGYAPDTHMWLDNSKLRSLGWEPTKNMVLSYKSLIDWMNQLENQDKN